MPRNLTPNTSPETGASGTNPDTTPELALRSAAGQAVNVAPMLPAHPPEALPAVALNPDIRQVLVVRHDLGMRRGKMAAQAAHASLGALTGGPGKGLETDPHGQRRLVLELDDDAHDWLAGSFKKICVFVRSEAELLALHHQALDAGMRCALIQDRGLTEFGGTPTYTVLAIGPHPRARLDSITGHLPLY